MSSSDAKKQSYLDAGTLGVDRLYNAGAKNLKGPLGLGGTKDEQNALGAYGRTPEQIAAEAALLNMLAAQSSGGPNPAADLAQRKAMALGVTQSAHSSNPFLGIKAAQDANAQMQEEAKLNAQNQLSNLLTGQKQAALQATQAAAQLKQQDNQTKASFWGNLGGNVLSFAGGKPSAAGVAPENEGYSSGSIGNSSYDNAANSGSYKFTTSDVNLKKDIKPEGKAGDKLTSFLEKLDPYTFEYKDKKEGEGERMGIMAQDLEKSPVGSAAVIEVDGVKRVDPSRLAMPMLAAQAEMIKKIKDLEDKIKKRS